MWVRTLSNTILDGNGVKAMPGSIPAPNPGSINNWKKKENIGTQKKLTIDPAASKNDAHLKSKSGHKELENNNFSLSLIFSVANLKFK